jgi:Tol biopolymer transport system component
VHWSPKRNLIAMVTLRPTVLIREATGRPKRVFQGVSEFDGWSPDGTRVFISRGGRPMIASAVGPRRIQQIPSARAAWSRDGRRLAYSTAAGLYIGDGWGSNAALRYSWPDPQRPGGPIEWSPDGRFVLVAFQRQLMTVDVATGTARSIVEGPYIAGAKWAHSNTIIFSTALPSRD